MFRYVDQYYGSLWFGPTYPFVRGLSAHNLFLHYLAETGIIQPGAFVEYQDGSLTRLGLVRATQVQAGFPEVWQTLGVQAYA